MRDRIHARIEFADGSELRVDLHAREIVFVDAAGREHAYPDHPLLEDSGEIRACPSADGRRALLGRHRSPRLHAFDASTGAFRVVPLGERLPGVEELSLHELPGDRTLIVTENGVHAVDAMARTIWQIGQTTYGWEFVATGDGTVYLSDAAGNLLEYDAATGSEASL